MNKSIYQTMNLAYHCYFCGAFSIANFLVNTETNMCLKAWNMVQICIRLLMHLPLPVIACDALSLRRDFFKTSAVGRT